MPRVTTPSAVMYAELKAMGISNREAASTLLNTALTFDGRTLNDRVEESSQLSRRIVHTTPGEIPAGLFNSFEISCPQLMGRILARLTMGTRRTEEAARRDVDARLRGAAGHRMAKALVAYDIDAALYRNTSAYIDRVELARERDRTLLRLMLFVVTGCLGDPRASTILVTDFATNVLGADFHTAQTAVNVASMPPDAQSEVVMGLVRVIDGHIQAGAHMHQLYPEGTELGLLPDSTHMIADVDADVSRSHAMVWREDGRWLIRDLGSLNGTRVISGADGTELSVGTSPAEAIELQATDVVCLGNTTRFIVMPVLG